MSPTTDTTFFNNEEGQRLIDRFKVSLRNNTQFFDVVVGYFRASGFFELYNELEEVERIRILVGLDTDVTVLDMINRASKQKSTKEVKNMYCEGVKKEIEQAEDTKENEEGVRKFIEFINNGKLEIKAYAKDNIHAKAYIIKKNPEKDPEHYGSVITGSSNFSLSGLMGNLELNVELKDKRDVDYASAWFESLWKDGVDVTKEFVDTVVNDTHFNDGITPYELYLKFLYEYFGNLLNQDKIDLELRDKPDWYTELEYQKDAVKEILQKLDTYGGVFLADVVGLGKTIVSCLLLQYLRKSALIICPPSVKSQWERDLAEFNISRRCVVESVGMLDKIVENGTEKYDYVFIDEAHRFRNEATSSYDNLLQICQGKKVVLISATPFNNNFEDLQNLIKLFHPDNLPGMEGGQLDGWFKHRKDEMKKVNINEDRAEYKKMLKKTSNDMRERVLKHLMVRRTRADIRKYYKKDMDTQGLHFPEPDTPNKIMYQFDSELENLFNYTIEQLRNLTYSRYNPVRYLDDSATLSAKDIQTQKVSQSNITGFMKTGLVKRLESSFEAFKLSLGRIKASYEKFIEMYEKGDIYISKKLDIYDLMENDFQKIIDGIGSGDVVHYLKQDLTKTYKGNTFYEDLVGDLELLDDLLKRWSVVSFDPKIEKLIDILRSDKVLKDNQVIIFSESKETVHYLQETLTKRLGFEKKEVYEFSGADNDASRNFIRNNFDPNSPHSDDTIKILVTTDVLAEGINLHKSNVILNYDIPWNPTRVLQRFGRVNRVGTRHSKIHIYNFFPTEQGNTQLDLERNVIAKMDAFLSLLGGDAQHLTEAEEIGSKSLFEKINSEDYYEGGDDDLSDNTVLGYLQELREIRDNRPELFERIEKLPRKTRSARKHEEYQNSLLTFFRKGDFLKIFLGSTIQQDEVSFDKAARILKCKENTPREKINMAHFYNILRDNTRQLDIELKKMEEIGMKAIGGGVGGKNRADVVKNLQFFKQNYGKDLSDDQGEFLDDVIQLVNKNVLGSKTVKAIKKLTENMQYYINYPIEFYRDIKEIIPQTFIDTMKNEGKYDTDSKVMVILSEYFI